MNEFILREFATLRDAAASEGDKGRIIHYSRAIKAVKDAGPIHSIGDIVGLRGVGPKTMERIADILAKADDATQSSALGGGGDVAMCRSAVVTNHPSIKHTPAPMPVLLLAHSWQDRGSGDPAGYWMSEKLDGMRAFYDGAGGLWSRNGNAIAAPQWFVDALPQGLTLDGELWCGRGRFQDVVSIARRGVPDEQRWREVRYLAFDTPCHATHPFEARLEVLKRACSSAATVLSVVEHVECRDESHLSEELERIVALGGEGLMLREARPDTQARALNDADFSRSGTTCPAARLYRGGDASRNPL